MTAGILPHFPLLQLTELKRQLSFFIFMYLTFKYIFIEVHLIYNFVLISAVQQSDYNTHVYVCLCVCVSYILFHYGLSQHTEYSFLCCTVATCFSSLCVISANPKGFHFPRGTNPKQSTYQCKRFKKLGLARYPRGCMATHSSILAWKKPWTEEPGRLQSMGPERVGCN